MIKVDMNEVSGTIQSKCGSMDTLCVTLGRLIRRRAKNRVFQAGLLTICLIFVNSFTGCMVGPDFAQPTTGLMEDFIAKTDVSSGSAITLSQWWQSFNDPKLNSLLSRAQSQNLTLRESYERIIEARANVCLQGGELRPNGDLFADYSYRKNSQNARPFVGQNGDPFNLFNLGFDASWELDLFGKIKRGIEAADAELEFERHDYQYIRQTLFADIVNSYLNIRLLQSQVRLIEQSLNVQNDTAILVSERMEAGVTTELDQTQTESFQHRTNALLASIRQQVEVEFNNLGLLMGQSPDMSLREFVGMGPLPTIPLVPQVGFPADLLRRRPDVLREEMAVKAASARIGIAEADLYPQLSLLGMVSVSAQNPSGLFETGGLDFSVGPSLRWNIFHLGRINNNIEIQQARLRQTIASYQNTALSAVREVEDAMINHQGNINQFNALQKAIAADEKSVQLSLERYRAGKANFQRVLDAQQQLLDDQRQSYITQSAAITQLVRLYKAAGGDWENGISEGSTFVSASEFSPDGVIEVFDPSIEPSFAGNDFSVSDFSDPGSAGQVFPSPLETTPAQLEGNYPLDDDFILDFE